MTHADLLELTDQPLDDAFWTRFVREIWEQRPCVLRRAMPGPFAAEAELFHVLREAVHSEARSDASLRLYRGTAMEHGQHDAWFPSPADADLGAWGARLREELHGQGFLLTLNGMQRFSRSVWYRARQFLAPLASQLDVPLEGADVDAFVGWYDATPEGVHKDAASNFMFVVRGPKTMQLWPHTAFADPHARRDEFHATEAAVARDPGIAVEVHPGDVLYWPSSAWHVGLSAHGLTACINLPLYVEPSRHADLLASLAITLGNAAVRAGTDPPLRGEPAGPSATVDALLAEATAALAGSDVHDALLDRLLRRRSAGGFDRVPPPRPPAALSRSSRVARDPRWPLAWSRTRGGELLCAGNGHSLLVPHHPALEDLLRHLESGASARVDTLIESTRAALGDAADEDTPDVLHELLATLVEWDVLLADDEPAAR